MGLQVGQRYAGVRQVDGRVLVLAVGAPVSIGVLVTGEQWFVA